ncbi:hypothetical protein WN943_009766 [Citrus x changshan-huyou]
MVRLKTLKRLSLGGLKRTKKWVFNALRETRHDFLVVPMSIEITKRDALIQVDLFVPLWSQVRTMTNGIDVQFLREKNDIGLPGEDYQHLFGEDPF